MKYNFIDTNKCMLCLLIVSKTLFKNWVTYFEAKLQLKWTSFNLFLNNLCKVDINDFLLRFFSSCFLISTIQVCHCLVLVDKKAFLFFVCVNCIQKTLETPYVFIFYLYTTVLIIFGRNTPVQKRFHFNPQMIAGHLPK